MAIYRFKGSVSSDLCELRIFLRNILKNLEPHISNRESIYDIRLILDELMVNGIIHGNKKNKSKYVNLNIVLEKDYISIKVSDQGCGVVFDFDSYDYKDMKCSGRGLILVKALADSLTFKDNEIRVIKNLK